MSRETNHRASQARIIVASNRASDGTYPDRTGPVIAEWLAHRGYEVPDPLVVPDGEPVTRALRECLRDRVPVVLTTGGTGPAPTDRTPEATAGVLDYELPGVADAVRDAGSDKVPTAVLSRGTAGVAGNTLVVNLPGSPGGVRDGLAVLDGILEHAVAQIAGGDHASGVAGDPQPVRSRPVDPDTGGRVVWTAVTESPLSLDEHRDAVAGHGSGAVATFEGTVRDHDDGRGVRRLDYEAHPSAAEVLDSVVAEVTANRAGVNATAVSHRIGALEIGDVALTCAVAAGHRAEAFATCAELVDEVKSRLPVWKHQVFTDDTDEWVNSP